MCVLTCYLSPACVPGSAASLGSERPAVCSLARHLYRDSPLEGDKNTHTVRVTDAAESELVSVFSSHSCSPHLNLLPTSLHCQAGCCVMVTTAGVACSSDEQKEVFAAGSFFSGSNISG